MNILVIILRILHIVAGISWAGGAINYFLFIGPTAKATAPESQKFMGYLMEQRQWTKFMSTTSLLTILAGGALYYRLGSVNWHWVVTPPGIGFTIGALTGILLLAVGHLLIAPRINTMGKISQEIQANKGSASLQQAARLNQIQKEMEIIGKVDFVLIMIAVLTMSTARYWSF
jgi:uncharacterized membrane protein